MCIGSGFVIQAPETGKPAMICTPGQVCSAVGVLAEVRRGWPSHVTTDLTADPELTHAEVAERMSGNLCRCGAYMNIVPAVRAAGGAS